MLAMLNLDNDVPDHTTISRRKAKLGRVAFLGNKQDKPVHILIDSSGLTIHAGLMRKVPKNRDYRKLHLVIDEVTGDILACDLTSKSARDPARVPSLLGQVEWPIASARADAAYDRNEVYEAIANHDPERSPRVLISPRKDAKISPKSATTRERNRNIRSRSRLDKRTWHRQSGYSKRSKVETTFYRYKTIVGCAMRARRLVSQRVEARIGCKILNKMAALGMPDSLMVG